MEALLRRSLGVPPSAQIRNTDVKPAPPIAQDDLPTAEEAAERPDLGEVPGSVGFEFGANGPEFMDWSDFKSRSEGKSSRERSQEQLEDVVEEALSHDEL